MVKAHICMGLIIFILIVSVFLPYNSPSTQTYQILTLATITYASATFTSLSTTQDDETQSIPALVSRVLVEGLSRKLASLSEFFNFKLRLIRFLTSLYTTENLVLLRNLLEYCETFVKLGLRWLPHTTEDPGFWYLPAVFEFINIITGPEGVFNTSESGVESGTDSTLVEEESPLMRLVRQRHDLDLVLNHDS